MWSALGVFTVFSMSFVVSANEIPSGVGGGGAQKLVDLWSNGRRGVRGGRAEQLMDLWSNARRGVGGGAAR